MWWATLYIIGFVAVLFWLYRAVGKQAPSASIRWWLDHQSFIEGEVTVRITTEQKIPISVEPKTAKGKPAKIDGDVAFASSDEAVARVEVVDGKSANVVAVGAGVAQITAEFDADLGEGVNSITASGSLEVVDVEATTGEIVFGEPSDQ